MKSKTKTRKKIKKNKTKKVIKSEMSLLKDTFGFIKKYKKVLFRFFAVYLMLHMIFVNNGGAVDLTGVESGDDSSIASDTIQAGSRAITSFFSNNNSVLFASALFVIMTLSYIWLVRQLESNKKPTLKDSFYLGMYPLFSVLFSIFRITLQLIPFACGAYLYSVAKSNNVITNNLEEVIFASIWVGSGLLSGYWVSKSILSMYAATLPGVIYVDVARDEVDKQISFYRWDVLRRFIVLPILIFAFVIALSFLPDSLVGFGEDLAVGSLYISLFMVSHLYLYKLYRSVL